MFLGPHTTKTQLKEGDRARKTENNPHFLQVLCQGKISHIVKSIRIRQEKWFYLPASEEDGLLAILNGLFLDVV